ncbi:ArsR/SmtB family transcription factor [Streptacidiphilus fuscans]|uniref:Winged helix-turn-helix transcriptional regulator n=1 Tax=Streptacidiphilus fuscans TaxID=2789292 RepID=A0A931FEL4_9ACTN|nr:metalloregulator ArsR/SmtB family transcription factor [Streptacidiphilus fuscans]MBF9069350.1 winged helix-turn-helix transcriptional regulator [Streptacidiphilus fuscans]
MADDQLSRAFTALADPTRRDIVARLSLGDATPGQLAEPFAMSLQAVSKHLKVLEEAGLISRSREAQRRPCHLETAVLKEMTAWVDRYRRSAEERFRRLDAVLATMDVEVEAPTQPHRAAKKDQAAQAEQADPFDEGVASP